MSGSHNHHEHGASISHHKMWIAFGLTLAFCIFEAIIGYRANSLALMADAAHNFADALALSLSAYAVWVATKPADNKRTFGYHRAGILAALANALGLLVMAGFIFYEAILRLKNPEHVQSMPMIWVALVAILLNSGIAWWLHSAAKNDLNIKSAYMHMLGDAAASFGVVLAGIIIYFTQAYIADPIVSIIFALLVLWSSWSILHESIQVLLEATPARLDLEQVKLAVSQVPGVVNMHDLHVWTVSSGFIAGTCHIKVAEQSVSEGQKIVHDVNEVMLHQFNIRHCTIQLEAYDCGGHSHDSHEEHDHEQELALAAQRLQAYKSKLHNADTQNHNMHEHDEHGHNH